jgi:hypothetical protein
MTRRPLLTARRLFVAASLTVSMLSAACGPELSALDEAMDEDSAPRPRLTAECPDWLLQRHHRQERQRSARCPVRRHQHRHPQPVV